MTVKQRFGVEFPLAGFAFPRRLGFTVNFRMFTQMPARAELALTQLALVLIHLPILVIRVVARVCRNLDFALEIGKLAANKPSRFINLIKI